MNDFVGVMDKINTILFVMSVITCIVVLVYLFINMKFDNSKKKIMINKNRVNKK